VIHNPRPKHHGAPVKPLIQIVSEGKGILSVSPGWIVNSESTYNKKRFKNEGKQKEVTEARK